MRSLKSLLFVALLSLPMASWALDPVMNFENVALPARLDGSQYTLPDVRRAILSGCSARGWTATEAGEGHIRASILVRARHYAEVDIPYSTTGYSIVYRDSRELDYNPKRNAIDGHYNNWVAKLSGTIQRQFGVRTQVF